MSSIIEWLEIIHLEGAPLIEFPCCQGIIHLRGLSVRAHWERIEVKEAEIQGREGKLGDSKISRVAELRFRGAKGTRNSKLQADFGAPDLIFSLNGHPVTCQFRYLGGLCHTKKRMSALPDAPTANRWSPWLTNSGLTYLVAALRVQSLIEHQISLCRTAWASIETAFGHES